MIRIRENVRFAMESDGGVLLDLAKNRFFDLNATGAAIWSQAVAGASFDQIVAHLSQETTTPTAEIAQFVSEFLDSLVCMSLVTVDETNLCQEGGLHE